MLVQYSGDTLLANAVIFIYHSKLGVFLRWEWCCWNSN